MKDLSLVEITKKFGSITANDNISIEFKGGTIHAIVGENGAGKSTLMNILYGLYKPDHGKICIDGLPTIIGSPLEAISHNIGMVHQHFKLISRFTVAENIVLGEELTKNLIVLRRQDAEKAIADLSDKYNLKVDPQSKIEEIGVGMQQRVEILKCLYRNAEIIIFDEPTAVLTPQEIEDLLAIFMDLKSKGKTVIFISHKLEEVKKVADFVTVIRHGKVVEQGPAQKYSIADMASHMVGYAMEELKSNRVKGDKEVLMRLDGVNLENAAKTRLLKNVSLNIEKGKILGIAGVDGNGQSELVDVIIGAQKPTSGSIVYKGAEISSQKIDERRRAGISLVPEDRHKEGLVLDFQMKENLILGQHRNPDFSSMGLLKNNAIDENSDKLIKQYDIRPQSGEIQSRKMSGGNQQKSIIAREVNSNPDFIIVAQPTRGVDIGASMFIREELMKLRDSGCTVLLVSLDLDEIFLLSDKIAVINHGSIVGVVDPDEVTRGELGIMMAGISNV